MHLVPFGEYMPFVKSLPWLQSLSPLCTSASPGERPKGFMLKNICLVPNICYETVLPHVIRNQLVALRQEGQDPQILVNVTNDGWFWGSSELEQHLACGVFRTVECRRPMVIAANTGISASIDASGHILAEGPRRETNVDPRRRSPRPPRKLVSASTATGSRAPAWRRRSFWPCGAALACVVNGRMGLHGSPISPHPHLAGHPPLMEIRARFDRYLSIVRAEATVPLPRGSGRNRRCEPRRSRVKTRLNRPYLHNPTPGSP